MTQQKESVVTAERFAKGKTWPEWMEHVQRNKEKFQYNYDETTVSAEDAAALKALSEREGGRRRCSCSARTGAPTCSAGCRSW